MMHLLRNAGFNFFGAALPAIMTIVTLPYIVTTLGHSDYGLLILITSIVGYFAVMDINVTAGSTKYVAQYHASSDPVRINETVTFGFLIYTTIGVLGMVGIYFSAQPLATNIFKIPDESQLVAVTALQISSLGFLIGQIQSYVQSLPGALMRYDISGRVEAVFGTLVPILTVALLYTGYGLVELVWLRVVMSAIQAILVWRILHILLPSLTWVTPSKEIRYSLLTFSAYSFLSRLAALTYVHADKLIIGARVGMSSLTFYAVPSTLANRVMALIFRLSAVMFPHASALAAQGRMDELKRVYVLASRYMFFINGATALTLATLAYPILTLWLNPEFARTGSAILVMIALAQWVDSLTNLPALVNDGLGHPKVSGLFAIARAGFGLSLIFLGVWYFGIAGAAGAHLVAATVMTLAFLIYVHGRTVPVALRDVLLSAYLPALVMLIPVGLAGLLLASFAQQGWLHLIASGGAMGVLILAGGLWKVSDASHRVAILGRVGLIRKPYTP